MTQEEFFEEWGRGGGEIKARTSGSTGKPKEILLSAEMVRRSAERTNRFFGITSASRLHVPLDFNYIAAKMMGVRSSLAGATLTSELPSNRPLSNRNRFSSEETIDLLAVVPSQMSYILDHLTELPKLRNIIIGGGLLPETLRRRIVECDLCAFETYGMTETASHIALKRVGEEWFETFDDIRVSLDPRSCLVIEIEGFESIETNDIAEIQTDRKFRIMGRADNVINTGGKKVYPEELERLIGEIWVGTEFAITSVPDEKWGERIVAVVVEVESKPAPQLSQLRDRIPTYMVPKEIRFVASLPRVSNGKLDRKSLR